MESIRIAKAELLAKLEENRADHRSIFEEALAGYHDEAIRRMESQIADLRAGRRRSVRISMAVPEDHTADYDRVIKMIQMSIGDEIILSENDFAQYVMDDWGWQGQFLGNTYGSKTATAKFSDRYDLA